MVISVAIVFVSFIRFGIFEYSFGWCATSSIVDQTTAGMPIALK